MKNYTLTFLSITIFILGFILLYRNSAPIEPRMPISNEINQQNKSDKTLDAKIDEQNSITVIVTPIDISPQSQEWKFDVGMNTHSVELDQDLKQITVLIDENGKEYKPLRWEGAEAGGHHREGVLIFNSIKPMPKSIKLRIFGLGGDIERFFPWVLQ